MKISSIAAIMLFALSVSSVSAAPASEKSVRELMNLTGAGNLGVAVVQNMVQNLKKAIPNAPESFWDEFMKEINPDELVNRVVPIYQKNLSEEDVKAAIKFYKTPAGKRLIEKQPIVVQESMMAGQQWGGEVAKRAMEKAKKLEANKNKETTKDKKQ